jgi:hypothetical protein
MDIQVYSVIFFLGITKLFPLFKNQFKNNGLGGAPVTHTYNPSYLGGWDGEDHGLRPAWADTSQDPHLQNNQSENGQSVAQVV